MSTYKANARDQKKAENIRRQYVSREDNKMEQLKKLDRKVKAPGSIIAIILGVIGALVMGSGMAMMSVSGDMTLELTLGIPGLVAMSLAYPIYALLTKSRKRKYATEILSLSDGIIVSEKRCEKQYESK